MSPTVVWHLHSWVKRPPGFARWAGPLRDAWLTAFVQKPSLKWRFGRAKWKKTHTFPLKRLIHVHKVIFWIGSCMCLMKKKYIYIYIMFIYRISLQFYYPSAGANSTTLDQRKPTIIQMTDHTYVYQNQRGKKHNHAHLVQDFYDIPRPTWFPSHLPLAGSALGSCETTCLLFRSGPTVIWWWMHRNIPKTSKNMLWKW